MTLAFLKSPSQFFCRISFSWNLANAFTDGIGVCVFGKVTTETNALLPPSQHTALLTLTPKLELSGKRFSTVKLKVSDWDVVLDLG